MATVALVGATGLVGGNIFATLQNLDKVNKLYTFSRKELATDAKVTPIVSQDSTTWPTQFPPGSDIFFSALGTTRAKAGGFENQVKLDRDFNIELAKAARAAGSKVYVLISSSGASSSSPLGYPKMKGELEDAVSAMDFEHVVLVRPGLIAGTREEARSGLNGTAELGLRKFAGLLGSISNGLKDFWAQDADVIAKAAVHAGLDALNGGQKEKVRVLGQAEIVRLGRTEWKA
ncbi:hypothetical protein CLAFUW4_00021 [Fulvia fulva]|uniref:NAD(P)-binding domain-containing protein n=1 Tax=Passalora fulva TaxID=5499 RepID=A0A9Q8P371_PASFU|nr:uncharacterized protein CLAFUR5_00020 [Fulvia fulva]KAK4635326.1 hypothetical protein CLAFUR4_00021 [Fulvia fulva]KAK4637919.1 hypothetical protein CLAFUR0_00021 [Fulvia fulva]UJO11700.1 hypothetical protein CLAFUR5_00020 [Fulvia fulva]WPV09578.1 hypothetical protein CLAFUW4_00021 [Fulvia fulva]WPV23502.1 hypothetical protein CLAFUW7_00021 [Fulvia fulva]